MNIIKASIRNAVRRKWKFALVVFLFGVGVVALTNAYDVAGAVERMAEASEAFASGEPMSEEDASDLGREMAGSGAMVFLFGTLTVFFGFGTLFFGFVMPGGMVANERRSTAIMLWAQHPMSLTSFYLQRYLGIQAVTLAALLVFGMTTVAAVFPVDVALAATEAGGVVSICLEGMLACAVSFGITALGIRRAALFGVVYYLPSGLIGEVLNASEASASTLAELARALLPFVIFPVGDIENLVAGFETGVAWEWGATGMVLYHFAVWTALAWLGLRRMEKRPLKL